MICGIVVAHNEDLILEHTIKKLDLPYIAILDNPTERVKQLTQNAIHTMQTDNKPGNLHVYQWDKILVLIKEAALFAKKKGFKWVLRVDADEDWQGAIPEILKADKHNLNIVNFKISQFKPLRDCVSTFTPEDQQPTQDGDAIHLKPDGNYYQRAWKLDTDVFNIGAGGHVILRKDEKVYNSNFHFKHYPAIDKHSLIKKSRRKYEEKELKKGWHIQYDGIKSIPLPKQNIHIFYHVALMGCWKKVLNEQLTQLQESGLLDSCKSATAVFVGDKADIPVMPSPFQSEYGGDLKSFEFPTLDKMQKKAKENREDYFLYIHSKGVSKPEYREWLDSEWRRYMMFGCVENWQTCLSQLQNGYDVAGVEFYHDLIPDRTGGKPGKSHGFFAGNFFWSTGKHLISLPEINSLDIGYRWNAESWIGLGNKPKVYELINLRCQDRKGMFPRGFCRNTYKGFNNIVLITLKKNLYSKAVINRKIRDLIKKDSIIFFKGLKQKFLMEVNFLECLQEPFRVDERINL